MERKEFKPEKNLWGGQDRFLKIFFLKKLGAGPDT
jgi:hypothetical protein